MKNTNLWLLLLVAAAALPWFIAMRCRAGRVPSAEPPANALPPARPRRRWGRIVVALLLALYVWLLFKDDLWFLWYGQPAEGTVVAEGKYGRRYEFRDAAGKLHRGKESLRSDRFALGESVHVRYLADDPEENRLIPNWEQRDLLGAFLFPVIAFAWYGWVYFAWVKAGGAWRALAEQYPDVGAGEGWQPWWSQSARFDQPGADGPLAFRRMLSVSAGANGLRFAGQSPFRYLTMPWHPAFVIPWSDLRAEPAGPEAVKLTAAQVPGVAIAIPGELANGIAAHVGEAWPAAGPEAPASESPAPPPVPAGRQTANSAMKDGLSEKEGVAPPEPASQASLDAFFASLQGPPRAPGKPAQPEVRASSVPALTVEIRGRTSALPPTTLQNVGISKKDGYQAVLVRSWGQRLDFKSSPESFATLVAVVAGGVALVWWLGNEYGAPIAVFVTVLFLMFCIIPLFSRLVAQRRIRLDRGSDAVTIRQFFRERFLCRVSDIVAVQVVGDAGRIELNLVIGDLPRVNLAALKRSDNRQRLLEHAQRLAAFLEVPLADQVETMAVVGRAGTADPMIGGPAATEGAPQQPPAAGGRRPFGWKPPTPVARALRFLGMVGLGAAVLYWAIPAFLNRIIPGDPVLSVAFSPHGKRLATARFNGRKDVSTVTIWDAATGQELATLKGQTGLVECLAFSPDGKRLASASHLDVKVWDTASGQELHTFQHQQKSSPSVAFRPDGKRLAAASDYRIVRVWDVATGREVRTLKGHTRGVTCVAFSPDGKRLASAGREGSVRVWDAASGRELQTWKTGTVWGVAFSPGGKGLATAGSDGTVTVWDPATGKRRQTFKGHAKPVRRVAFSRDGKRLASGGQDGTVKVWEAATGRELLTVKGHPRYVWRMALSPDGKRLASGSKDGPVKVWEAATGQEIRTLK
jgi:DNA-binding beta-propeller fold protein YncE